MDTKTIDFECIINRDECVDCRCNRTSANPNIINCVVWRPKPLTYRMTTILLLFIHFHFHQARANWYYVYDVDMNWSIIYCKIYSHNQSLILWLIFNWPRSIDYPLIWIGLKTFKRFPIFGSVWLFCCCYCCLWLNEINDVSQPYRHCQKLTAKKKLFVEKVKCIDSYKDEWLI